VEISVAPLPDDRVEVRIADDGLGVEQSRRKKAQEADHISRGIEITKGRADVLRKLDLTDIRISGPTQQHDAASGKVTGTLVTIVLPADGQTWEQPPDLRSAPDRPIFEGP
jgi:nitrate/nitrite-specific signal transduction histidine kinase